MIFFYTVICALFLAMPSSYAQPVVCHAPLESQQHQAVLWRGFNHRWTYNHRINRLGDYAYLKGDSVVVGHTSASGRGPDSAYFTSYYSLIEDPHVFFHQGSTEFTILGKENQLITKEIDIQIPLPQTFHDDNRYTTLLNGFDLFSLGTSDKLQLLSLSVEDAQYASAVCELHFRLKLSVVMNCQSPECEFFNQDAVYRLRVHYIVVAGDDEHFSATPIVINNSYHWTRRSEPIRIPQKQIIYGRSDRYRQAALGIKSFTCVLDKSLWIVNYDCHINPVRYQADLGIMETSTDLFFTTWVNGMKKHSVLPKSSALAFIRKGWCLMELGAVLLQFSDAEISHHKLSGQMFWRGRDASADHPNAKYEKISPFNPD